MTRIIPILLLMQLAWYLPIQGQHFLKADGKVITNESGDTILLRGMGLGGWMVQEGYMLQTADFANPQHAIRATIESLIGPANTALFYDAWLANHCREADIDSLKAWGFNSVRLPMHYNLFTLPIEDEPVKGKQTWLNKGFELTDSLIAWCKAREMYVILDLHAAPGGQGYDQGISDYDPTKPSLWESQDNQDKMAALWKRLADRYKDEQWVAGYDLLNEPNWNLPGGAALRALYEDVTDSIRSVDTTHMIIIEGNWFANDFTGLTPPWDDNMVYSPHKYWSVNDQASIQWVLNLRDQFNVPLYLGETGENSNVWFRDAVRLYEDNNMGWAWWPMKKVESVAGPLSVAKTPAYETLLNYWRNGGTKPSVNFATTTLLQLAEDLKVERARYQKDVIDALFRQPYSDETVPYANNTIPGIIYAPNYDMGTQGVAYNDLDYANYSVTTGNYTAWNNGWSYRNDGVDVEPSQDKVNTNGFMVGFTNDGEWMDYTINVTADGVYDVNVRVASGGPSGGFHLEIDGADATYTYYVPITGGWNTWQNLTIPEVILNTSDTKMRVYMDRGGYNLGSFEFVRVGPSTSVATEFIGGNTVDTNTIQVFINKQLDSASLGTLPGNFTFYADRTSLSIAEMRVDPANPRILYLTFAESIRAKQDLELTYTGTQLLAQDGTPLAAFQWEDIENTLIPPLSIPGKIEAEDFSEQQGAEVAQTNDVGGGDYLGYLDAGDYMDYDVEVTSTGTYKVDYRVASEENGSVTLQLIDANGQATDIHTASFPATGSWDGWTTYSEEANLPAGKHKLRLLVTQAPFNINWMDFSFLASVATNPAIGPIAIYPNPTDGLINVRAELQQPQSVNLSLINSMGQMVYRETIDNGYLLQATLDLRTLPGGCYLLQVQLADGSSTTKQVVYVE